MEKSGWWPNQSSKFGDCLLTQQMHVSNDLMYLAT